MIVRWQRTLWASIAAGWMLIAVSYTFNYFYYSHHYVEIFSTPPTFLQMLVWEIPYWILWAALAPVVFEITRRFPLERESWMRNAAIHVAACLALTVGHRIVYLALCRMLFVDAYRNIPTLLDLYRSDLLFNLPTGFMSYATFLLAGNIQTVALKASRLEAQLAKAELQALKSQLQPHFLFNTLNSISALQLTDLDAANRMTARLGDFLRLTLEASGTIEVPLHREIEFLQSYLEIERVRFQDRLTVQIDVDPDVLDIPVPNLILQPIVENALRHGIGSRIGPGRIAIAATRHGDRLRIEVRDNGKGLSTTGTAGRERVGIANTKARLQQFYGEAHYFEMIDAPEGGVIVTLEMAGSRI
jgi:two-component system, LytTR family, sensor kinase